MSEAKGSRVGCSKRAFGPSRRTHRGTLRDRRQGRGIRTRRRGGWHRRRRILRRRPEKSHRFAGRVRRRGEDAPRSPIESRGRPFVASRRRGSGARTRRNPPRPLGVSPRRRGSGSWMSCAIPRTSCPVPPTSTRDPEVCSPVPWRSRRDGSTSPTGPRASTATASTSPPPPATPSPDQKTLVSTPRPDSRFPWTTMPCFRSARAPSLGLPPIPGPSPRFRGEGRKRNGVLLLAPPRPEIGGKGPGEAGQTGGRA
jgi:hypothetical protein